MHTHSLTLHHTHKNIQHQKFAAAVSTTPSLGDAFEAARRRVDRQQVMQHRLDILALVMDEAQTTAAAARGTRASMMAAHTSTSTSSSTEQTQSPAMDRSLTSTASGSGEDCLKSQESAGLLMARAKGSGHGRPQSMVGGMPVDIGARTTTTAGESSGENGCAS